MHSTIISIALFGASTWAQFSPTGSATSTTSSSAASATASESDITVTGTATTTVPPVGANSNGPAEVAFSYCFPSSWAGIATDTPCYSMEVLNQACFYGPSVFETATATPTSNASPKDQQSCYCDEQNGVGYMYFEFMQGCASCFREHGSLGSYGAYDKKFVNQLSSAYCAQPSPSQNFGKFLTAFGDRKSVFPTADAATSDLLGTKTDVSLYFTTVPTGGFANATTNGTTTTSGSFNSTTATTAEASTTAEAATTGGGSPTAAAIPTQSTNGATAVQVTSFFGAMLLGFAAFL